MAVYALSPNRQHQASNPIRQNEDSAVAQVAIEKINKQLERFNAHPWRERALVALNGMPAAIGAGVCDLAAACGSMYETIGIIGILLGVAPEAPLLFWVGAPLLIMGSVTAAAYLSLKAADHFAAAYYLNAESLQTEKERILLEIL